MQVLLINPKAFKLNRVVLPVYSFVTSLNMYVDIFELLWARIDANKDKGKFQLTHKLHLDYIEHIAMYLGSKIGLLDNSH